MLTMPSTLTLKEARPMSKNRFNSSYYPMWRDQSRERIESKRFARFDEFRGDSFLFLEPEMQVELQRQRELQLANDRAELAAQKPSKKNQSDRALLAFHEMIFARPTLVFEDHYWFEFFKEFRAADAL